MIDKNELIKQYNDDLEAKLKKYSSKNEKWLLFISPTESATNDWEVRQFENEKDTMQYVYAKDLTKEWYAITIRNTMELVRTKLVEDWFNESIKKHYGNKK